MRDLEARIGQGLHDAFRNLFCFLGIYCVVRMIFSGLAKRCRYDRNRLMRVRQANLLWSERVELQGKSPDSRHTLSHACRANNRRK
jgi:hypothetical protein